MFPHEDISLYTSAGCLIGKHGQLDISFQSVIPVRLEAVDQAVALYQTHPDSKVHGANMGSIWDRQDPDGPHVGPMNFAIWAPMQIAGSTGWLLISHKRHWRLFSRQPCNVSGDCYTVIMMTFLMEFEGFTLTAQSSPEVLATVK